MELTGKQMRNGATDAPGQMGTQSADPGPNYTSEIAAAINASTAAGNARAAEAAAVMTGPAGVGIGGSVVGAGGNIWEWDSGLPIMEQMGEIA
jgi:hypothetical protein